MKASDIATTRMLNQGLIGEQFTSARDCLNRMGVIQAQDFAMVKWALGVRIKNTTEIQINLAIDRGEIVRTHLLRPTWHLVSADHVYWMLDISAPQIKTTMRSRNRQLGLTDKIFRQSNKVIEKTFDGTDRLTREQLIVAMRKSKINTDDNRASHLLMHAELCGLICSGPADGLKNTYAILEQRVARPKSIPREEAVTKLAGIYYRGHGPATIQDFAWWAGLGSKEAKQATENVRTNLMSFKFEHQEYFTNSINSLHPLKKKLVHFLPAYDELLISYKDRSAIITTENHKKAVSSNGIFYPTIILNGQVIGTWKREIKKNNMIVYPDYFQGINPSLKKQIKEAAINYSYFSQKELII